MDYSKQWSGKQWSGRLLQLRQQHGGCCLNYQLSTINYQLLGEGGCHHQRSCKCPFST